MVNVKGISPQIEVGRLDSQRDSAVDRAQNAQLFRNTLNSINPAPTKTIDSARTLGSFEGVKFSNHALERMQSRGIRFNSEDVAKLNEAVGRAAAKGSKDSLILMNDSALIVSVKNKTVVTVMDKNALKENVFTNIDSTIVM
jgi:flagellar operon protein